MMWWESHSRLEEPDFKRQELVVKDTKGQAKARRQSWEQAQGWEFRSEHSEYEGWGNPKITLQRNTMQNKALSVKGPIWTNIQARWGRVWKKSYGRNTKQKNLATERKSTKLITLAIPYSSGDQWQNSFNKNTLGWKP